MRLAETVTFGGAGIDRAAHLRSDADALARMIGSGSARVLPVWRGKTLCDGDRLGWLDPSHPAFEEATEGPVFLGRQGPEGFFARDISAWLPKGVEAPSHGLFDTSEQAHPAMPDGWRFAELRQMMTLLSAGDAELAATAKALLGWHASHRFCSACGAASGQAAGGWQRACPACGAVHFPRTDPVVIMLVTRGNRLLLGRSPGWPAEMYSLLAGFMEPGETIEAAVRREVAEETGVQVGRVSYLASQPWPYPSSIMIGCRAEAKSDAITIDPAELEAALWLTREELALVFAGSHASIRAPRRGAIAGFLMSNWLADRLD